MDEKEIREGLETLDKVLTLRSLFTDRERKIFTNLKSLAEQWLAVKMPEKKDFMYSRGCRKDYSEIIGYNQALDDCRLAIAKHYISREEHEKDIDKWE
jgi:hypothetical protein